MRKLLFIMVVLLLLLAPNAQAGPHPVSWIRHHPIAMKLVAASASGAVELYGVHHCQQGDIERCLGHYGYGKTIAAVSIGFNFAMILPSEKLGGWQGDVLSYGWSGANLGVGIENWRNYKPEAHERMDKASYGPLFSRPMSLVRPQLAAERKAGMAGAFEVRSLRSAVVSY